MKKANRRVLVGLCIFAFFAYAVVDEFWPQWFPMTDVVMTNQSGQEASEVAVEMPGEVVVFGTILPEETVSYTIKRRWPSIHFKPTLRGTLADGTPIAPIGLGASGGVPFKRLELTIVTNGHVGLTITMGNRGMPNKRNAG